MGFFLDRRELDEIYEKFLALADRQKTVENQQIADLIAKNRRTSQNAGDMFVPFGNSVTDGEGRSYEAPVAPSASSHEGKVDTSLPDRLASLFGRESDRDQQEDYLWGV
jgi:hypothetical protein